MSKCWGRATIIALVFAVACVATQGESLDETTSATGSGSGSCTAPALSLTLAPTPLATELRTTNRMTVIVQTSSFASSPAISLAAFDADTGAAVSGWSFTPTQTVAMPASGTAALAFDVTIPSDSATLSARLRARAVAGTVVVEAWGQITIAQQITIEIPSGVATTVPHPGLGPQSLQVRTGTKLRFHNNDTIAHPIHAQGGIFHEAIDGGQPSGIFEATVMGNATWYCHAHEAGIPARMITVVP